MSQSFSLNKRDLEKQFIALVIYVAPSFLAISGQIEVAPEYALMFSMLIDLLRRFLQDNTKTPTV